MLVESFVQSFFGGGCALAVPPTRSMVPMIAARIAPDGYKIQTRPEFTAMSLSK